MGEKPGQLPAEYSHVHTSVSQSLNLDMQVYVCVFSMEECDCHCFCHKAVQVCQRDAEKHTHKRAHTQREDNRKEEG